MLYLLSVFIYKIFCVVNICALGDSMKFKMTLLAASVLILAGCSTTRDYQLYSEAHRAKVQAEAMVEAARWSALAEVAKSGDASAKVAVAMAVQAASLGKGGHAGPGTQIMPPKSTAEVLLQWGNLILPNFVQFYGINRNSAVAMRQSDNATALGIAQSNNNATVATNTNAAFVNMATAGLTTANAIAGSGFASVTTVANNGISGVANVANAGFTSLVTVSNAMANMSTVHSNNTANITASHANAIISLSNTLPNLQPNITTTTTTNNTVGNVTGNVSQ
jgi:hypothetical protein